MCSSKSRRICAFAARGFGAGICIDGRNSTFGHHTNVPTEKNHKDTENCPDGANDTGKPVVGIIVGVVQTQSAALHFKRHKKASGRKTRPSLHYNDPTARLPSFK